MSPATPTQASAGATPRANELPNNIHFTVYGIQQIENKEALFELHKFEIHKVVDVNSPCFIDMGQTARYPGVHSAFYADRLGQDIGITDYRNPPASASEKDKVLAATAAQREANIEALGGDSGVKAIVSASGVKYPTVSADCNGPADQLPPPKCIDDASNQKRLDLCQKTWDSDENLWEGTDRVLTAPLHGTTYGMALGINPINLAPIGGAAFYVDEALSTMDAYAIFYRTDDGPAPGTLFLYGTPTEPTRGVTKVHMTNVSNPNITAELAVFADLGEDDEHF